MLHVVHVLPVLRGTGQLQNFERLLLGFSIRIAWFAAGFALHGHAVLAVAEVAKFAATPLTDASVGIVRPVKRRALAPPAATPHDLRSVGHLATLKIISASSSAFLPFLFATPRTVPFTYRKCSGGSVNRQLPKMGGAGVEASGEMAAPKHRQKIRTYPNALKFTRLTAVQMVMSCAA